jgi:hypothetical protein
MKGYKWSVEKLKNHKGFLGKNHSDITKKIIGKNNSHPRTKEEIKNIKDKTKIAMKQPEVIEKISKTWFKKGQIPHNKGKVGWYSGELASNWQGGKSFEEYPEEFKLIKPLIRTRDNFICQECGFTEKQLKRKLSVHHIDYNKKNNNPNNLISLCVSCHTQTNYSREDWEKYFHNKMGYP